MAKPTKELEGLYSEPLTIGILKPIQLMILTSIASYKR